MTTHVGILPVDVVDALSLRLDGHATAGLRFLRLLHPRTGIPSLFLPYASVAAANKTSLLEVQAVVPPNARSWFMGGNEVVADGKLLIMTPIDPAFLLIPILQSVRPDDGTLGNFRQLDDIIEDAAAKLVKSPKSLNSSKDPSTIMPEKDLMHFASLHCFQDAMRCVCDVREITTEIIVYRFSTAKLVEYLRVKVARVAKQEVFECSRTMVRNLAKHGLLEDGKEDLLQLGHIRAACDLVAQYLPPDIRSSLLASYDLKPLDIYLNKIQQDAVLLAAADKPAVKKKAGKVVGDNTKDGQKRKAQAGASQGVEKLKKVNISGMAKLSSFFQPK